MRMFWGYAEIWLNAHRLRTVQSRINLRVTLNRVHHVGTRNLAKSSRCGDVPAQNALCRDRYAREGAPVRRVHEPLMRP